MAVSRRNRADLARFLLVVTLLGVVTHQVGALTWGRRRLSTSEAERGDAQQEFAGASVRARTVGRCEGNYTSLGKQMKFKPSGFIDEESGIAASIANRGVLWVHNDNYSPKRLFAVDTTRDGHIVANLDLETLPKIGHETDFEDVSIALCPFQQDLPREERKWCIWLADTGTNMGSKEVVVYAIREPRIEPRTFLTRVVGADEVYTFTLEYEADFWGKFKPNIEAIATRVDGSRLYAIQKTYAKNGQGPASIWESPDLGSLDGFVASNAFYLSPENCTLTQERWVCEPHTHNYLKLHSKDRKDGDSAGPFGSGLLMDKVACFQGAFAFGASEEMRSQAYCDPFTTAIFHMKMTKRIDIENPYPDCRRYRTEEEEAASGVDGEHLDLFVDRWWIASDDPLISSLPKCVGSEKQPGKYTCRQQREWGKCEEAWIVEEGLCEQTCRRCVPERPTQSEPLVVRSVVGWLDSQEKPAAQEERRASAKSQWQGLERACNHTKPDLRNVRNIAGADLHHSGKWLLLATYGGIFEYRLLEPFDFSTLQFDRQVSPTNRDGSEVEGKGRWKGQEGVCYDYTRTPGHSQAGKGIWSVSEHHKGVYYLACNE